MERFAAAKTFATMSSPGPYLFDISRKLPERIGAWVVDDGIAPFAASELKRKSTADRSANKIALEGSVRKRSPRERDDRNANRWC